MTSAARSRGFWIGFLAVTLPIAGGLSYLASSSPDGLDSATLQGCRITERGGEEVLTGQCIAQHARAHPLTGSPLADYSVRGLDGAGGLAGIIGVVITLALAAGLFRFIARSSRAGPPPVSGGD